MAAVPADANPVPARTLQVELVYCAGPHQSQQVTLALPQGSTVADALAASSLGIEPQPLGAMPEGVRVGVWGKAREPSHVLRAGDRVEVYRSLLVDPKEARRLRYAQHKAKLASLGPPRLIDKKTG